MQPKMTINFTHLKKMAFTRTNYISSLIEENEAFTLYFSLAETIPWTDGIRTRYGGFTRKAYPLDLGDHSAIDKCIYTALLNFNIQQCEVEGIYLNYYRNGNDFCPMHSHKDTRQIVISLGATRTLMVGKQKYPMNNGDAIIFGSALHGVPRDTSEEGRISIAIFLSK
jgi:hypothetical protein